MKTLDKTHRAARLTGLVATAAALAGCAAMAPHTTQSASTPVVVAVAPAWQAPVPGSVPTLTVPAAEFWARFGDPALPALLLAAQASSPNLAAAAARIERARAIQASAGAALLPDVGVNAGISQGRSAPGRSTATSANLGLQAGWELDLFGANAAGSSAASVRLRGAQAALADARTALAAETTSALTTLRACQAQAATTEEDAASRAETSRLTELTANAGFTAPADAALARAGAAQARAQATQQRGQCDILIKSLVELTALAEPDLRDVLALATARLPDPPAVLPPALPAQLLVQRPDLQEAALAVRAAAFDVDQAAARELPSIRLSGAIGGVAVRQGGENQRGTTWSLGPVQIDFPLFDAGSRAANTVAARAEYDSALVAYSATVRRAVREVETSLVQLRSTAARFDDARSAAADFDTALVATQARQRGGLASLLDLETARRNALAAQSGLIELQRERAAAWVSLVRAVGAGWRDDDVAESANSVAAEPAAQLTISNLR